MKPEQKQNKGLRLSDEERKNRIALQKVVGSKLYALRFEKQFDQGSVAKEIGISKGTLSKIENGHYKLDFGTIVILAAYYKKPLDYFLPPHII